MHNLTLFEPEQLLAESVSVLPLDKEARSVLVDRFPESSIETRACNGRKGNFLEEQNALDMILGCFLDSCLGCAGEVILEF